MSDVVREQDLSSPVPTTGVIASVRDTKESQGSLVTEEMVLNIGPQHPSTHGVLRIVITVDGERIVEAEPVIGYMHRGYEKLCEVRDYRMITNLLSRMDWLSGFNNEIPASLAVEKLMDLEVPERAQWIRVALAEMNRILNHLAFIGSYGLELGAITPGMYTFRERETLQTVMEIATGGRMHFGFVRPGGLKEDLPLGFVKAARSAIKEIKAAVPVYEDLLLGNEIFRLRSVGVGVLPPDVALSYGVTGPILRASGVDYDVRKASPYLIYDRFDFNVPVGSSGDCYDRLWVLMQEVLESCKIVEQALDGLPAGSHLGPTPKRLIVPEGETFAYTENPLGILGMYLVSTAGTNPYRLKIRTPSFSNVSSLPYLLEGALVADMIAILGSMFFVLGDIDR